LALPQPVDQFSLTTLREMLIEIGAKVERRLRRTIEGLIRSSD
jgi:hypothetical protein